MDLIKFNRFIGQKIFQIMRRTMRRNELERERTMLRSRIKFV